ncbi:hypothetical protein [uncultured Mediterranean phage uvMED]|nr:hypothetical protein [uncultured Mediterranean phage uvMED]BAQ87006.1 hypothetical protein [uncultured Mediterranean phage uvMED]BAQ87062.1 hypothetical protein [uncultured Mediterranean phage uvMED]BAR16630.1 hypothetical protein [uncultured Mediterranean phage uvMED]BAR16701.1 hypothetical protein [uncultured Mediterranean phage uvMED]
MGSPAIFISVATTLVGAKLQKDAYETEAQANEEQANMAELEAEQQSGARRNQFLQMMSALNVSEGSRGISVGQGGSSKALQENEKKYLASDLSSIKLMGMNKARQYRIGASQSRLSGKAALISGVAGASGEYMSYKERTKQRDKNKSIRY